MICGHYQPLDTPKCTNKNNPKSTRNPPRNQHILFSLMDTIHESHSCITAQHQKAYTVIVRTAILSITHLVAYIPTTEPSAFHPRAHPTICFPTMSYYTECKSPPCQPILLMAHYSSAKTMLCQAQQTELQKLEKNSCNSSRRYFRSNFCSNKCSLHVQSRRHA